MTRSASNAGVSGILPKNDERPPFLAFAVSLYRSDLLFRGLVDLAVSGFVILVFTSGLANTFQLAASAWKSAVGAINKPVNEVRTGANQLTTPMARPGRETLLAIKAPQIPDIVIERSAPATAAALTEA